MAKQKIGDFYVDKFPPGAVIQQTIARTDFNAARNHAITLITIHDEKTGGGAGRPPQELEALKRSALILAVTAWESFVEDSVTFELDKKLNAAASPSEVSSVFNGIASEWLDPERNPRRHGPDLLKWTGDSWKERIRDSLSATLETFHTPNTENTNRLFKRYLGVQIQDQWSWNAMSKVNAQKKLDALIKLRGRVTHRGKTLHPSSAKLPDVKRGTVVDALNLLYSLVFVTEVALGVAPTVSAGA